MAGTFQAGGLASGLDTNTIIDKFVALESQPITRLKAQQAALKSRVSILGDLMSALGKLDTAARALADGGALAVKAETQNQSFTAVPGSGAPAGRFSVQVQQLAAAAKARSAAFASAEAPVAGGTLGLRVQGQDYTVEVAAGSSLADVAFAIRQSGAPVSAVVISDGTSSYLSVTSRDTGFPLTGTAADALAITENLNGGGGQALGLATFQPAQNARLLVDGLLVTRASNNVADALPGVTLNLKSVGAAPEDLVLSNDVDGTGTRLKDFLDAYNALTAIVGRQMAVTQQTDRSKTLAGDAAVRGLQSQLQGLLVASPAGLTTVRTLADVGFKTARDGTVSVDATTLGRAIARDPGAVNQLFADATSGVGRLVHDLYQAMGNPATGLLKQKSDGLSAQSRRIDDSIETVQRHVDAYRARLVAQFAAMENVVSALQSTGQFLAQQGSISSSSSK
jgi:flagellar hook-associated protein 2